MADGKWVMTEEDMRRMDSTSAGTMRQNLRDLPNFRKHITIDNSDGKAVIKCAFCGSEDLQSGFGGCGEGFGYQSVLCKECGGTTDLVYKDEIGKFFLT